MKWYRQNPLFASALTLSALIALGEIWCIYDRFAASRAAAVRLAQRTTELQGMAELQPPPTRAVATTIEADLARARRAVAAMQGELQGRGAAAERIRSAKVPTARTDAYFDLATFVEKTRELARKHEVEIRPDVAHFGFAAYANEGPDAERIEPVFRQRLVAQYLVESLFEARPRALLLLKREPAITRKEREEREAARASAPADSPVEATPLEDGPDYFAIDPRVSVRAPGYIDTTAFRITFSGQTVSLRAFLNRLATFELPVLVREVEVEPATADEAAATAEDNGPVAPSSTAASVVLGVQPAAPKPTAKKVAPKASAAAPIVAKPYSKFTVTVEYLDLVTPPAASADGETPPTKA
ncbi:MAG: hypothetical protein EXS43_11040 [Opitutus sp.]|nr:hypothetical protein [Opitutus sp.]